MRVVDVKLEGFAYLGRVTDSSIECGAETTFVGDEANFAMVHQACTLRPAPGARYQTVTTPFTVRCFGDPRSSEKLYKMDGEAEIRAAIADWRSRHPDEPR